MSPMARVRMGVRMVAMAGVAAAGNLGMDNIWTSWSAGSVSVREARKWRFAVMGSGWGGGSWAAVARGVAVGRGVGRAGLTRCGCLLVMWVSRGLALQNMV